MTPDLSSLESALRCLRPAALDESLLARLEACTRDDDRTALNPAAASLARRLQQCAPASLPPELMASLEATVRDVPFPGTGNIVPFPQSLTTAPRHYRGWWQTAAAVAVIGAVSALFMPTGHHNTQTTANTTANTTAKTATAATDPSPLHPTLSPRTNNQLVPAGFNRSLAETHDEGLIWQSNQQPQRVLKVVYMDQVTLKDTAGRTYQVEQPRVEYILVPANPD